MLHAMCRALAVIAVLAAACSDSSENGPFDELPLAARFEVGMLAPTHVARDRYGVAHIHASTLEDAAFAQGYVMAHDRLPQMDILRRFGAGTLSELFGALDPDVITGWNVVEFDLSYLDRRCKQLGVELSLGRGGARAVVLAPQRDTQPTVARVPGRVVLDGIATLRSATWSFESFRLDHVARAVPSVEQVETAAQRVRNFDEVNRGLESAVEAHRCFSCGHCTQCDTCLVYCPEGVVRRTLDSYSLDYSYCKGCGICVHECPRKGMEMSTS